MKNVLMAVLALPKEYPGLDALNSTTVYLMGCMSFGQFCCTWRSLEDPARFCPFCPTELARRGRAPLFCVGEWMLLENEFPRTDTEQMLLIVPHRHVINVRDLNGSDWRSIGVLFDYYEIGGSTGGGLLMRFGDPRNHAGTIDHLHLNVVRPLRESGCSLPLAKNVEGHYGHKEDYERLHKFVSEIRDRGGVEWLFSDEGIVETQPSVMK